MSVWTSWPKAPRAGAVVASVNTEAVFNSAAACAAAATGNARAAVIAAANINAATEAAIATSRTGIADGSVGSRGRGRQRQGAERIDGDRGRRVVNARLLTAGTYARMRGTLGLALLVVVG